MNLSTQAIGMGYKHAGHMLKMGRSIPYSLEAALSEGNFEKARAIANPEKIDQAYRMLLEAAETKIRNGDKVNWYRWAKPRGHRTSADLAAENVFKEFYKGEPLTPEEKSILFGAMAIRIDEELTLLKKDRNAIKI